MISPRFLPASDASQSQARDHDVLGIAAAALVVDHADDLRLDLRARSRVTESGEHLLAAAFLGPRWKERPLNAGAGGGVGIRVDRHVDASCPRFVHCPQRLDAPAPVGAADDLVMRDLRRESATLANRDRLVDAVENAGSLIPHVRDVDAAEPGSDLRQFNDLIGLGERARHVEESRAQAEAAVLHPFLDERPHLLQLVRRGLSIDLADDARADGPLADERTDIDGLLQRLEFREERRERHGRGTVGSLDERGHALPDIVVGGRDLEDAARGMRMDIDEPGRHDLPADVDGAGRGLVYGRRDASDRVTADPDVAPIPGAAGPVDDSGVAEQQIVRRDLSRWPGEIPHARRSQPREESPTSAC